MTLSCVVLGRDGMLGSAFMRLLGERGIEVHGFDRPELDLLSPDTIDLALETRPGCVINCTGFTDVDGAESEEALATSVNGAAVGTLIERCDALGIPMLHYSTDYVFDGRTRDEPYPIDHPVDPINAYGRSKRVGEEHVERSSGQHLLIRTSWLYAPWGNNFVLTMARLAGERDELRVVNDQRGRPTSAEHLAEVSLSLLQAGERGTFHVTDGGECTWFDLATEVVGQVNADCKVVPCTSEEYPRPAARPAYSVLDIRATEQAVGALAPWQSNVRSVLERR
jgi:dTDP-4-dehydrorhamnose reductase